MSNTIFSLEKFAFSVLAAALFSISIFGQTENLQNDLRKNFGKFDVVRLSDGATNRRAAAELSFTAAGKDFRLELAPRDLRSARYQAQETTMIGERAMEKDASAVKTYQGRVAGENDSAARLTLNGERTEGFFISGGERFYIESARKYSTAAAPDEFIVYRGEDFLGDRSLTCHSDVGAKIEDGWEMTAGGAVENLGALRVLELATEADYDYVVSAGSAAAANQKILEILNMVEGLYERELDLTISVTFQHAYSTPDPFNGTNTDTLLRSFQTFWNATYPPAQYPRDAAHLFSYKPNIRSQGFAFLGEICKTITPTHPTNFAYGLSGRVPVEWNWEQANTLITAHEIGHNLGATHNDSATCTNTLMNSSLGGGTQLMFCSVSRAEIANYVAANGTCLAPQAAAVQARFDFEGDGRADVAIWRPSNGVWSISQSSGGASFAPFGAAGDLPVAEDYDGDGKADLAVYRAGVWYRLQSATNTFYAVVFGNPTDLAAPADYDGDDKTDIGVFRPVTGQWFWILSRSGTVGGTTFGARGDVPLPADYDGDGKADVNVFRPATGTWFRINSSNNSFNSLQFGLGTDRPLVGDFDGDSKTDVAVWRSSNAFWYIFLSASGGLTGQPFGVGTDVPTPADYDGDGKADISVFRPSTGQWFRLNSSNGGFQAVNFGAGGDIPVHSYYQQ